jgi:hypothetical protein
MKYACGTPEICPRRILCISLPLPQTGESMSLRLISIICVFVSYYSHYHYLYPCRQREGLVRKYFSFQFQPLWPIYLGIWPLMCLAVAHSVDHRPVTTEDRFQSQAIRCWICGWHIDIGTCCISSVLVYFASVIRPMLQNHVSAILPSQWHRLLIKRFHFILISCLGLFIWTGWLAGINNHNALQSLLEYLFLQTRRILKCSYFNLCAGLSRAKNYSEGTRTL